MKKKGMLIATIVMVLVLAVSLTTATYAWFTETSLVQVDTIAFEISSAADMVIGVHENNTISTGAKTAADYWSGGTYYTAGGTHTAPGTWEGEFNALGSEVNFDGLTFADISKAVGTGTLKDGGSFGTYDNATSTFTPGTDMGGDADTAFNMAHYTASGMIQAEGQGGTVDTTTVDAAWKNVHYLDVVLGIQATNANLETMTCYVTVTPRTGDAIIGMNAAIHVAWRVVAPGDDTVGDLHDVDIYGDYHFDDTTVVNAVYNNAKTAFDTKMGDGYNSTGLECLGGGTSANLYNAGHSMTVAIPIASAGEGTISVGDIYQLQLVIYIAGADDDCQEAAKGVASTINITFAGVEKAA
ncbi:MAG: hypothetical protein IJY49_01800 [Clostridia bacterium]|nr:hypothetical protein [Clostridia bacterium]